MRVVWVMLLLMVVPSVAAASYVQVVDDLCSNTNVVQSVAGGLWIPWYGSSTSCQTSDLKKASSCNSGQVIDLTHNCMASDEFSQVAILISVANNQARMDQIAKTVDAIRSTHGTTMSWRSYRNGNSIEACRVGVNSNCDAASDADARVGIAFYLGSENPEFDEEARAEYLSRANQMAADVLRYEVVQSCKPSSQGYGQICYWLAAGPGAKSGGMASTDFGYSGYYQDAIELMLRACDKTGNVTYCTVAGNLTLNYLQAAKFDGVHFSVPPGRSFMWTNLSGTPVAVCTNTCSPVMWDAADAPRALGICGVNNYALSIGVTLPGLGNYCEIWRARYMLSASSVPYQFYPGGNASASYQSGYMAQGLEALFYLHSNLPIFDQALANALNHYHHDTKSWDNAACFGIYTTAFALRAQGVSEFSSDASPVIPIIPPEPAPQNVTENLSEENNTFYPPMYLYAMLPMNATAGDVIKVNVKVVNASNIGGVQLDVLYANLSFINVTAGTFLAQSGGNTSVFGTDNATDGWLKNVVIVRYGGGADGYGVLLQISFIVTGRNVAVLPINVLVADANGTPVNATVVGSTLLANPAPIQDDIQDDVEQNQQSSPPPPELLLENDEDDDNYTGGYYATYTKTDLPLIIGDGIGTAGASVVEWGDVIIIGFILLGALGIIKAMKIK